MIVKIVLITSENRNITPQTMSKDSRLEDCLTVRQKGAACNGSVAQMFTR